jgi:hypothetical protein
MARTINVIDKLENFDIPLSEMKKTIDELIVQYGENAKISIESTHWGMHVVITVSDNT